MTASLTSLPVLDVSRARGSEAERRAFRDDLRRITHEVGFFYLVGHGIPSERFTELVRASRAFFDLPDADKLALENTHSPHFRGYTRVGGELTLGKVDWREQIDIGAEREAVEIRDGVDDFWVLQGPNLWPSDLPELQRVSDDWIQTLSELSQVLLTEWALALGASADHFADAFDDQAAPLLKIVRYPGQSDAEVKQGVGAHKDVGVLTLLYVEEGKAGLQVEYNGEWIDAPPLKDAFVVNIGEMLEIATNGYLKATVHRVLSPPVGDDRVSIPFFFGPRLDARIPRIALPADLAAQATGVGTDAHNSALLDVFGANSLKSRVRAHPNVVETHYPQWSTGAVGASAY